MRYDDWDVLLFPWDCGIPMKEFQVSCHLVQDPEFSIPNCAMGLPTMTCFIPSLEAGSPFHISIHSWVQNPEASTFTKAITKHPELVKFQARIYFDGRLVGSDVFDGSGNWPQVINNAKDNNTDGQTDILRFPMFLSDVLQQNSWSAADDLGRIKVVISEAFSRGPLAMGFETVKNIVAFSFQHAPLALLEAAAIAWPNPSMWLETPIMPSRPNSWLSSRDKPFLHAHSSRRPKPRRASRTQEIVGHKALHTNSLVRRNTEPVSNSFALPGFPLNTSSSLLASPGCLSTGYQTPSSVWVNPPSQLGDAGKDNRSNKDKSNSDTSMPDFVCQAEHNPWTGPNSNYDPSTTLGAGEMGINSFNTAPPIDPAPHSGNGLQSCAMTNPFTQGAVAFEARVPACTAGSGNGSQQPILTERRTISTPILAHNVPLPLSDMPSTRVSLQNPNGPEATPLATRSMVNVAGRPGMTTPMSARVQKSHRTLSGGFFDTRVCKSPLARFGSVAVETNRLVDGIASPTGNSNPSLATPNGSMVGSGSLTNFQLTPFESGVHGQGPLSMKPEHGGGGNFSEEAIIEALGLA